jgi:hypothetical protein
MWLFAVLILSTFFLLRAANAAWARVQDPGMVHVLPTSVLWCFFPGFAALCVPWPLTVWLLRRWGRTDEADEIYESSSSNVGFDSYTVMKWMSFGLAGPIFVASFLAVPIHLSIGVDEARLGHFASFREDRFDLRLATRARMVETTAVSEHNAANLTDLIIDFSDGRSLRANAVGDGGTSADPKIVALLLDKTHLSPSVSVQTGR